MGGLVVVFLGGVGVLKMGVDSGGWGRGGQGGGEFAFFLLFLFFFFFGVDLAEFQNLGCLKHNLSLERKGGWRGERGGSGGEEASDCSDEFCFVELEFFGGVEAARVGEGGGELVGSFGEGGEGRGRKGMGMMESFTVEGGKVWQWRWRRRLGDGRKGREKGQRKERERKKKRP